MTSDERDILSRFEPRALRRVQRGEMYFDLVTARDLVRECRRRGIAVIGLEAFTLVPSGVIPAGRCIYDGSGHPAATWEGTVSGHAEIVEGLLEDWIEEPEGDRGGVHAVTLVLQGKDEWEKKHPPDPVPNKPCPACGSADTSRIFEIDRKGEPPASAGHELTYIEASLHRCHACRGGFVRYLDHDCFDWEDTWNIVRLLTLDAGNADLLDPLLSSCSRERDPLCACPLHESLRSSLDRVLSGTRGKAKPIEIVVNGSLPSFREPGSPDTPTGEMRRSVSS